MLLFFKCLLTSERGEGQIETGTEDSKQALHGQQQAQGGAQTHKL